MHSAAQRSGSPLVGLEWTETLHSDHTADPRVYGQWPHLDSQKPTQPHSFQLGFYLSPASDPILCARDAKMHKKLSLS